MSGNRTLLVMRHAKSSWKTNEADARRPLSGRGTRDAVVAGRVLAAYSPDLVWCSSATRAVQTWEGAQLGGAQCGDVRVSDDLYAASGRDMLVRLQNTPASANTVLLIAHEPGLTDLISLLAVSSPLRSDIETRFPTSAIAVLTHSLDWDELAPGSCELTKYEIPRG